MSSLTFSHTVTERFLRYVTIDTQSDPASPRSPSTEKQKELGRVLAAELKAMGVADAHLDEYGYVYGTIPANTDKKVPVICFCSHMDTSPDCSGKNVKPNAPPCPATPPIACIAHRRKNGNRKSRETKLFRGSDWVKTCRQRRNNLFGNGFAVSLSYRYPIHPRSR